MTFRLGDLSLTLAVIALAVTVSSSAFARSQASLGDLTMSADVVADWTPVDNLPLDTSGWRTINVTSSANASSIGCSRAIPNDGADDAVAIACMIKNAPKRSVIYMPTGEYHCAASSQSNTCLTMTDGERVLRGDGAGATIFTSARTDMLILTDNYAWKSRGAEINWTGNYARGSQVLRVASTSQFSDGDWVLLRANPHPDIDAGELELNDLSYAVKITCSGGSGSNCAGTGPGQIRIDRPLRADFDSGGQHVQVWNPYVNWGIENMTMRYTNNGRDAQQNISGTRLNESVESWVVGVEFENADNIMMGMFYTARMKVEGTEFGLTARRDAWQKAAFKVSHTHDSEFVNNVWSNSHVAFQVQGLSSGNIFAYNRLYRPTFPGYQWCERSFFFHGGSAIDFLVEGNDFECGLQWDGLQGGAGHRVALYRNRGRVTGDNYRAATGGPTGNTDGSFIYHADIIVTQAGFVRSGWHTRPQIKDWLVAGNNVERMGHERDQDGWGINGNGSGMNFEHNVIREGCGVEGAQGLGATGCENRQPWDLSRLPRASNTRWLNNPVGVNSTPSSWSGFNFPDSLAYSSTPEWWCTQSGTFPNIGSPSDNFGNISSLSRLPAQIRNENGACTPPSGGNTSAETPAPAATFPAPILLP